MMHMVVLGSANAVPQAGQENTHLLARTSERSVLIDCGDNPITHFQKMQVDLDRLTDLVLTHFHPDHVAAMPLLLMDMWLVGRKSPLRVHGLEPVIERAKALMDLFEYNNWPGFYPLEYHCVSGEEMSVVIDEPDIRVLGSPVRHMIPTMGLRIEDQVTQKVVAYSCDTEPCPQVVRLGKDADLLIHEATGKSLGHSSPAQAAEIANQAGARELCLIHYPGDSPNGALTAEAAAIFKGSVILARDLMEFHLA
jgi:ribonuclease Z